MSLLYQIRGRAVADQRLDWEVEKRVDLEKWDTETAPTPESGIGAAGGVPDFRRFPRVDVQETVVRQVEWLDWLNGDRAMLVGPALDGQGFEPVAAGYAGSARSSMNEQYRLSGCQVAPGRERTHGTSH
jgi:hypothetical protein